MLSTKITLFCLLLSFCCLGQNAYHDVVKIKNSRITVSKSISGKLLIEPDKNNLQLFNAIFKNYLRDSVVLNNTPDSVLFMLIKSTLKNNPFIDIGGTALSSDLLKNLSGTNNKSFSLSSIGSLNVTNLADGIAQFLIKRGKEELNVAFFSRFKKFLDSTEECRVLFPQTIEVFANVEPYKYAEFIQTLRDAFNKDLSNLVVSLNELIELPKYQKLLQYLPEIQLAIRSLRIVQELSQSDGGILPDSVIHELASLAEWGKIDLNLGNSWKLLDAISQSVRYIPENKTISDTTNNDQTIIDTVFQRIMVRGRMIDSVQVNDRIIKNRVVQNTVVTDTVTRRWIRLSDMNALIKDTVSLRIFLGLVYQKMDGIYFKINGDSISVQAFLKSNATNIVRASSLVENFITLANDVDRTIKDLKDKQRNNLLTGEDYYSYINKAINITEYGFKAANTVYKFNPANAYKPDMLTNRYIIVAKNGNDLYRNIYSKNYNNAIMNVYTILDQLFIHTSDLVQEKMATSQFTSADSSTLTTAIKSIPLPDSKTIEAILKYGNFMASVVKAESGEEVESALEAAALPAGSYSVKQKSAFNISFNGYIGYGWDFKKIASHPYASGIYAPVGVSFSHGFNRKNGITLTAFVSLIDVGSVATYRLQDDTTKTLKQEVRLESIFSPSAQLFIEPFRNFPLVVGGGWRRTPKLFYSGNTSFTTIASKSVFNVLVLIDIPIFTIANKPFYKKE